MTKDVEWDSHSCVLGFDVMGVWPQGADGTDVNAVSRSNDHELLASGDDSVGAHRKFVRT